MTAASNSEARKRASSSADPVKVAAQAMADRYGNRYQDHWTDAVRAVNALRENGFTL